ncbi:MAG: hypothetical protein FWB71_04740, partial [Defluviitaleaceae bacterium]|nr:hypothetical protein [Defluviitaleaceae bacterium]
LLVAADITPMMEFTKIWRGGLSDIKFLDYTDVNRWFRTLQLLRDYIMTLTRRHFVAGTFRTGSNRYHQMIGIGRI